jgi:hypothetical protein
MVAAVAYISSEPFISPVTPKIVIPSRIFEAIIFAYSVLSIPTVPEPS